VWYLKSRPDRARRGRGTHSFKRGGELREHPQPPHRTRKAGSPSYADVLAPDVYLNNPVLCPKSVCPYSLFDFFIFSQKAQPFVPITTASYQPSTFENWGVNDGNVATDPDTDAYESAQ
jgi:hypothetical protein